MMPITTPLLLISPFLFLLLVLVFPPILAQLPPITSTCAGGVPTDGTIPATWPQKNFTLVLTESTNSSAPSQWLINGSSPGPRLDVRALDWVQVTVTVEAANSSLTALHWHGLTMYSTPYNDGVAGISQCGLSNGSAMTYRFCAYPTGEFWYRGLSQLQTMRGLYGPLIIHPIQAIINGTSTALPSNFSLYDQDIVLMIADTYTVDLTSPSTVLSGAPPQPQQIVVNGQGSGMLGLHLNGSRVIIRLFNAGSLRAYWFEVDGVELTVVSLDGSTVQPVMVPAVRVGVGQRVAVTTNFSSLTNFTSVLFRVTAVGSTPSLSNASTNTTTSMTEWVGVAYLGPFNSSDNSLPSYVTSNGTIIGPITPSNGSFSDVNGLFATPISYEAVGSTYFGVPALSAAAATTSLNLDLFSFDSSTSSQGSINNVTFDVPMLESLDASRTVLPLLYAQVYDIDAAIVPNVTQSESPVIPPSNSSQYALSEGAVVGVVLFNSDAVEHSFHLHGHSFWVIGASDAPLAEFRSNGLYVVRDTVVVPALGWARIRFPANNPGAWLLSDSSDFYLGTGLAVAFLEGTQALIPTYLTLPSDQLSLCNGSLQAQLAAAYSQWTTLNAPVTYANSALSQASRIVIGSVVGGVAGGVVLVIILCTVFGIKRDDHRGKESPSPAQSQ